MFFIDFFQSKEGNIKIKIVTLPKHALTPRSHHFI